MFERLSVPPIRDLEQQLERNEIVTFDPCPFALPVQEERAFLFEQKPGSFAHKNISYNPNNGETWGLRRQSTEQAERLRSILARFADSAQSWLAKQLPGYARGWLRDRVIFHCQEEATRRLRRSARNDLLHVDAYPSRPTRGYRILRLFVNIDPIEPRVWAISGSFAELLDRFCNELDHDTVDQWKWKLRQGFGSLFQQRDSRPTPYDAFMLRLQHLLKANEEFQEQARRTFRHFLPQTAWLALTDGFCHAELRGQFALEHSLFVAPEDLVLPEQAPFALWQRIQNRTIRAA